jgi:amidase
MKSLSRSFLLGLFGISCLSGFAQSDSTKKPAITCAGQQLPYPRQEPIYAGKLKRDLSAFSEAMSAFKPKEKKMAAWLKGADIPSIQTMLQEKKFSSRDLVLYYLSRIQQYDIDKLNAVLEINPDLLKLADAADAERKGAKKLGPMQGIPVLLKDNIATGDRLHTSAGTAALYNWDPSRDAFLVSQLRKAGAIILGKANLSEWANYMDPCMPSGFSTLGGQTRNPYGSFDTWGSSSGSAVAVAADLVTVSVGSETQGSIIMPAGINSVVGLKTSMGMISRDFVIPLLAFQDVVGPMGKSVTDVAVLLGALTGMDKRDPTTTKSAPFIDIDFRQFLRPSYFRSLRVGVVRITQDSIESALLKMKNATDDQRKSFRAQLEREKDLALMTETALTKAGVTVVPIPAAAIPPRITEISKTLSFGFRQDLNAFLKGLGSEAPFASLEAIIAYNQADPANRSPYGQRYLIQSQNNPLGQQAFDSLQRISIQRGQQGIDDLLQRYQLDVIASSVNQTYAPAGYPALSVPAGYNENGQPRNLVFVGTQFAEHKLLGIGFAFEQQTKARRDPDLEKVNLSIQQIQRVEIR